MSSRTRLALALCLAFVGAGLWSSPAYAQSAISGVVKDESGAVMPGVSVEAASEVLIEKVRTAVTDESGAYRMVDLRPGKYLLTFTLQGFAPKQAPDVVVRLGQTITVNINLEVGGLTDTVQVTSEVPGWVHAPWQVSQMTAVSTSSSRCTPNTTSSSSSVTRTRAS